MATKTAPSTQLTGAPTMKPEIVTFRIRGMSPLLHNNPQSFIGTAEDTGLVAGKKTYDDEEEARMRLYVDDDGDPQIPSEAFIKSMIRAVTGKKFGKVSAPSVIRGSVFFVEPRCQLLGPDGKPAPYTIDRRPVVVGKARILRCRPCFMSWETRLALDIDTAICAPQNVLDALSLAGRVVGVGDYRPEKGGSFGRFVAEIA